MQKCVCVCVFMCMCACVLVCVCMSVLAFTLVVAVLHAPFLNVTGHSMQLHLHELASLVQLEPQVGVDWLSWDQRTLDSIAVDAGVHGLVLVHAHAQVLQDSFERLVIQAIVTSTNALVHYDILGQSVLGDGVPLVDEGVDLLELVNVSSDHGLGDESVDEHVIEVSVARQDGERHARHSDDVLVGWRTHRTVQRVFPVIAQHTEVCLVVNEQL
jgi:hypothetical protein